MNLLDECLEALGEDVILLYLDEKRAVINEFEKRFPLTRWGRIDWPEITHYVEVKTQGDIEQFLTGNIGEYSKEIHIIWDENSLPVLKTSLDNVFQVLDDVTAVSFDTWFFSQEARYVIELFHDGEVKVGLF